MYKTNLALSKVTSGDYKLDKIVVAVMADDPAETLEDAQNYTFGVQYQMNGEQIQQTIDAINKELGTSVAVAEYSSLAEQAQALHDGTVDAIVYNEGYTGILEEAFEGYSSNTKVIYSHNIKSKVENKSQDVEVKNTCFSVYISGIDVYGAIETNSRSDVNIIAEVNPTTHQILLITTPRDYYVEIPGISGGQKDKLTHAGIYGVDASMATLNQLYGMNLDFYARVNFTSLIDIVDALGGVDVESEYEFTTSEDSGLVMNVVQGTNHFQWPAGIGIFKRTTECTWWRQPERKRSAGSDYCYDQEDGISCDSDRSKWNYYKCQWKCGYKYVYGSNSGAD